jgi:hypothetical protein
MTDFQQNQEVAKCVTQKIENILPNPAKKRKKGKALAAMI